MSKRDPAEKIAELIAAEADAGDLSSVLSAIERIEQRLERLESAAGNNAEKTVSLHPSAEHFEIAEAIAGKIFADAKDEKACSLEPNGKPCDHCSMCNSRGF